MDDYTNENLVESRNEWVARLIGILQPHLAEGINSIFKESYDMCVLNNENNKYLMTFQNFLSRIPSWNQTIIDQECERIITNSKCNYINDLLTCVHVIMLKSLTNVRVCKNQKKIDIDIPKFERFIHNVYIQIARKLYKNIYLYEQDCTPLQKQKNNRECEIIIRECILGTIRDNIPVDTILRAYMSENMDEEVDVVEDISHNVYDKSVDARGGGTRDTDSVPGLTEPAPHVPPPAVPAPPVPVRVTALPVPAPHVPAPHVPALPVPAESSDNLLKDMNNIIKSDAMDAIEFEFDSLPESNDMGTIKINSDDDESLLSLDDITEL